VDAPAEAAGAVFRRRSGNLRVFAGDPRSLGRRAVPVLLRRRQGKSEDIPSRDVILRLGREARSEDRRGAWLEGVRSTSNQVSLPWQFKRRPFKLDSPRRSSQDLRAKALCLKTHTRRQRELQKSAHDGTSRLVQREESRQVLWEALGPRARRGGGALPNMRMHLPKPRAPFSKADQVDSASSQVIRGR